MKHFEIILLFVLYNVVSGIDWSKECNVVQNTVTGGVKIVQKVFQNKTETAKKITNDANIGSIWKLKKFTRQISERVEDALKTNNVDNLREFLNLLNSTINTNIDKVQKDYNIVSFAKIVEDTHGEYQKQIIDSTNNKSAEFTEFLDNHNEISDCSTFKYQHMLTTLITDLEQEVPVFITLMEDFYNSSLSDWRNKIESRKTDFIKSLEDCEKHDEFKCCIDDFIAGKGFIILKEIDLNEEIKKILPNIFSAFKDQALKAILTIEQSFSQLYGEIAQKC